MKLRQTESQTFAPKGYKKKLFQTLEELHDSTLDLLALMDEKENYI